MENKSHALAAGTFVVVLLALLVGMAVWLTRDNREFRIYELSSQAAVTGLQPQAAVRFKGVNVGKVTTIGFDPLNPSQVLVRIAVNELTPITASTFATLGFQGVTGLAFVQLDDTGKSKAILPDNPTAPTRIPIQPSLLSKLSDQGESILLQLEETSRRMNQLLSPENQKVLIGTLDSLGQAGASIAKLSSQADQALPLLVLEANITLKALQDTSARVSVSADEARASARAFKVVTERMNEPGGTLDKLSQGVDTLAITGQTLNAATLPRLNRAVDDAARATRQVGRAASIITDNPQSLIYGSGPALPGPGEPGFSADTVKP